jgi:hypothetical protein
MKSFSIKTLITVIMVLGLPLLSHAKPVLFYTDIVSGPNSGGQNNAGVFVRAFGKGFGTTRGTSTVTIGGGQAANYPAWSDTEIAFQLGANAQTGSIVVNSSSGASNALPFTVRSGRIFFIDDTSPSSTGTGTYADPWRSPETFYDTAQPGDTAYLRAGTYSGVYGYGSGNANLMMRKRATSGGGYTASGTSAMPIAWLGYPGETALFSAPGPTGTTANVRGWLGNTTDRAPDWIVFGNLSFLAYNSCIGAGGTPGTGPLGWRIVNNRCQGLTRTTQLASGSIVPGADYAKVLGNYIYGGRTTNKLDHAIYSQACASEIEIAWNRIYDNNFGAGPLISINYESDRCATGQYAGVASVHDNIVDATNYPSRGLYTFEQSYTPGDTVIPLTRVWNNVFINCGVDNYNGSIHIRDGAMEIFNNTFYNSRTYAVYIGGGGTATPDIPYVKIYNNIFHMRSDALAYYELDPPGTESLIRAEKNIYYGLGSYTGVIDPSPINANPMFVNAAGLNFHLSAGSPAIQTGSTSVEAYVARDLDGFVRSRSTFDIGAYLYNSNVPNPPLNLRFVP